jgi:hypothetical protein
LHHLTFSLIVTIPIVMNESTQSVIYALKATTISQLLTLVLAAQPKHLLGHLGIIFNEEHEMWSGSGRLVSTARSVL